MAQRRATTPTEPEGKDVSGNFRNIVYGLSQISSKSDEDRYSLHVPHNSTLNISSFGVFDGHGGNHSSTLCAEELNESIMNRYFTQICNTSSIDYSNKSSKVSDIIFCEATKSVMVDIDYKARKLSSSCGTTAVSIFIFPQPDGSARVLCPWIGDSKCCMFQTHRRTGMECSTIMSQEHKPALKREFERIINKTDIDTSIFPIEANMEGFRNDPSFIPYNFNEPKLVVPKNPSDEESEEEKKCTGTTFVNVNVTGNDRDSDSDMIPILIPLKFQESFIRRRVVKDRPTAKGEWAIHGRYGMSLTMTRSIGDRYGARSCVCVPDISALTLAPNEYARFVLASDGLWDVVSVEAVQTVVMGSRDPSQIARKLALMAWHKRVSKSIRMDDITVLVVDVNPESFSIIRRRGRLSLK
eukprot:gene12530-26395_t